MSAAKQARNRSDNHDFFVTPECKPYLCNTTADDIDSKFKHGPVNVRTTILRSPIKIAVDSLN
jgi:hypothetical protein